MQKRKEIPRQANKNKAIRKAREFIVNNNICWLPVDPFAIYEQQGWLLFSWKEAREVLGDRDPLFLKKTGADARTSIIRGTSDFVTVYDASVTPQTRIRWTLAHEIGHIVLEHLHLYNETSINRGGLTPKKYKVLEDEADFFAAELLQPITIVKILGCRTQKDVMRVFNVSRKAAANRLTDVEWWGGKSIATEADYVLQEQFKFYLQPVSVCPTTLAVMPLQPNALISEVDFTMNKVAFVAVNKDGRFNQCPRCGNTVFSPAANFCKMCGLYLDNTCPDIPSFDHNQYNDRGFVDGTIHMNNPGDARYCEHCGEETMLSRLGLLMSWEEVIDTFGDIIHGTSSDSLIIPEQVAEHGVKEEDWADLDSIPNDTDEIPW
jgi:hypothetical protein